MCAPELPLAELQGLSALLKGNANKLFKHSSQWCGRTLCENMETVSWLTCMSPGRPTHYRASTHARRAASYHWFHMSSTWDHYEGTVNEARFPLMVLTLGRSFTKFSTSTEFEVNFTNIYLISLSINAEGWPSWKQKIQDCLPCNRWYIRMKVRNLIFHWN